MIDERLRIIVDGVVVEARRGQTVIQACDAAGIYIPRLCYEPSLPPGGHCRVCTCRVDGRYSGTCYLPVADGMVIENDIPALNVDRRTIIEMLFVEGNHFCPACEQSGDCELQALGYRLGLVAPTLPYLWQPRVLDTSHPEIAIDRDRCVLCSRCVRASRGVDGKTVFGFEGRGIETRLAVDAAAGLGETDMQATDRAAEVCPVGCILTKGTAYRVPIGQRRFDRAPIGSDIEARRMKSSK